MKKQTIKLPGERPLLDLVSYGRGGLGVQLTREHVEQIRRTVHRVPEAMVKVLPRGSGDLNSVRKHLDYIQRHGKISLETDGSERMNGKDLLLDWDLDIDDVRRSNELAPTDGRKQPKLAYKLMFSMPAGTPPTKVLEAVRNFAREEFALKHRYAFVLHTDEPHPHVHMIVKAVSEQGVRLNIRKATLRYWRGEFARHLRALGVAANATERAVRGEGNNAKKDAIYRAATRGDSSFVRAQAESVAAELLSGTLQKEHGRRALTATREEVIRGWNQVGNLLAKQGERELSADVADFIAQMKPIRTDRERVAHELLESARNRSPRTRIRT